jgi:hypothetical protein
MKSKPIFIHDSTCCKFLGNLGNMDLYVCGHTYLLRFGSDGPDYWSNNDFQSRKLDEVMNSISGSNYLELDYFQRIVGIQLFATMLAGVM